MLVEAGTRAFKALQLGPALTGTCLATRGCPSSCAYVPLPPPGSPAECAYEVQHACDALLALDDGDTTAVAGSHTDGSADPMELVRSLADSLGRLTSLLVIEGAVQSSTAGSTRVWLLCCM